jgi:ribonuclease P/MRP protein subunit RPP40
MEHIVFHSIMEHVDEFSLLTWYQHGFQKEHSTESQLIVTLEEIARALDQRCQVDVQILDFSKAFDTVPHRRLLNKIDYYGIRNKTKGWIKTWLTSRSQRVVVDGEASDSVHVDSGVPQGTVLGPLMFLLYINDIGSNINSTIKLFADDCLLYRVINSTDDTDSLQRDLSKLDDWADKWQMGFNAKKCYTMRIHRKRQPIIHNYKMKEEPLKTVPSQAYLGVEIHERLSWKPHITAMTSKAARTLGFIRRNLSQCSSSIKQQAYTVLVRSQLEYAGAVWDPHRQNQIDQVEKIQRRGVRFICGNYKREESVTAMRVKIGLPTLEERRKQSRLTMLYKIVNNKVAIPLPEYIQLRGRVTRSQHKQKFTRLSTSSDAYRNSFFPRTLKDWDELPNDVIELPSIGQFKGAIGAL